MTLSDMRQNSSARVDDARLTERRGPLCNRSADAVFLAYHSVAHEGPPLLTISPHDLERQLATLRRAGYRSGTHDDLERLRLGHRPDRPLVFLTFDDGNVDNYTIAFPLLRTYGFGAMVYVLPGYVDGGRRLDWPGVARSHERWPGTMRSMTWDMVEEMAEAGIEFGSPPCSPPRLPELPDEELERELVESRERIVERLGTCRSLAYPFGEWNSRVAAAAAAAGYE